MRLNQNFLFCMVASIALVASSANADEATITLDLTYNGGAGSSGSWELFGRVDDTAGPADGQFGLSAVRALIDNIDFGTLGDAITLAPGNGAIDPLDPGGPDERPAALQQPGTGIIDLVYGQDITGTVVFNVGNSGDTLLASGTFSAGSTPAFGVDNTGPTTLLTQALFMNSAGTFGIDADVTSTVVTLAADYNGNGIVDAADYTVWRDGNSPDSGQTGYDLWKSNFGIALPSAGSGAALSGTTVPEPSTLVLAIAMAGAMLVYRQRI